MPFLQNLGGFALFGFKNIDKNVILFLCQTHGVLLMMTGTKTSPEGQETNTVIWIGQSRSDPYWERCATRFDIKPYENIYDAVADILIEGAVQACVINGSDVGADTNTLIQTILSKELARSVLVYNLIEWPGRYHQPDLTDSRIIKITTVPQLIELLEKIPGTGSEAQIYQTPDVQKTDQPVDQTGEHPFSLQRPVEGGEEKALGSSAVEEKNSVMSWPMEPPVVEHSDEVETVLLDDVEDSHDQNSEIGGENEDQTQAEELENALNLDKLASRAERKTSVDEMDKVEIDNNNFHLAQLTSEELDALLGSEPDKK